MGRQLIILAAGKGKRMGIDEPKVLNEIHGQPMIKHLLMTVNKLNFENKPIMVVGYQAEKVKEAVGDVCDYVLQVKQLGTGHAVACAKEKLKEFSGEILILYGDMPLITETTIRKIFLSQQEKNAKLTMATAKITDFADWRESLFSFGRIIRNDKNEIIGIREKVDCAPDELAITEVNPSFFCFDSNWLWQNIEKLKTDNKQNELYLTDLVKIAFDQKLSINSVNIEPRECLGVNTREQLEIVEKILRKRRMGKEFSVKFK